MKFQLINEYVDYSKSAVEHILINRGIPKYHIGHYLNTTDADINNFMLLGEKNLTSAAVDIVTAVNTNKKCLIVIDSDCDGFSSAAILINYLYDLFPAWVQNNLSWFIHSGKQHGLSDCVNDILNSDYSLVILPDSSSNDYEYHKQLADKGIKIIVLDHHEAEKVSENAIIINNQLSKYPNKDFSGAGITWQFCRYLDSLLLVNFADNYLDLVALGNCADMMNTRNFETKHIINKGFKQENLKNPFIYEMANKNHFKLGDGDLTFMGVAFYIAPFVNAMVRSGTQEEKELLFNSMLKFKAFDKILSNKRGHKLGEMERVVDQALRTVTNVKNRQTRAQDAGLEFLENMIEEQNLLEHKVLLFLLEPGQIDRNIAGLIANKFMAKYQRPCCILTKVTEKEKIEYTVYDPDAEEEVWDPTLDIAHGGWRKEKGAYLKKEIIKTKVSYQGSARGYDKGGVDNFKDICAAAPGTIFAEGHQSAFGLGIEEKSIAAFIENTDEVLKDMNSEPLYYVDYIFNEHNANADIIIEIAEMDDIWSSSVDEPFIAVKNIKICKEMLNFYKENTIKITLNNGIALMIFNTNREEYEKLYSEDGYIEINAICRCNKNEWNGRVSAQLFIEDYEIIDSCAYIF